MQKTIEIARKLAELGQAKDAQKAYALILSQIQDNPEIEFEAASYIFFSQGDYKTPYTVFVSLYNRGYFKPEIMNIMLQAFYEPNLKKQKKLYEKNCKALSNYPYLFKKDFLEFDNLPILFFPFDNNGFIPYNIADDKFEDYVNFNDEIIDRYFFKDLEKPILADDVFSQYQLEYLNDNVRKSEWVARENHIYLHYKNWAVFCAYLQCIDWKAILRDQKFVFLIEDEIAQYPIDFKERFGIDYSEYTVKPIGIREIKKLIWHTQLSSHNGGDFFNEIFYGHPNLLTYESLMLYNIDEEIKKLKKMAENAKISNKKIIIGDTGKWVFDDALVNELVSIKNITEKDAFVAFFLSNKTFSSQLDISGRIIPAIFFQPHFHNIQYTINTNENNDAVLLSEEYELIKKNKIFKDFKYIKTFTPMRRITTSYAASVKFALSRIDDETGYSKVNDDIDKKRVAFSDTVVQRVLNRSFMVNSYDRLYHDSRLVRFEDGKLNPKATFTALAEFLDIPYTESMTYCSSFRGINTQSMEGNAVGFDPVTVYRTYDEFANFEERYFIEYFMRDAYKYYGYNFNYYDGAEMTEQKIEQLINNFAILDNLIDETVTRAYYLNIQDKLNMSDEDKMKIAKNEANQQIKAYKENRIKTAKILMEGLRFVNKQGQPLRMMTPLKLDPELLEQPLYH